MKNKICVYSSLSIFLIKQHVDTVNWLMYRRCQDSDSALSFCIERSFTFLTDLSGPRPLQLKLGHLKDVYYNYDSRKLKRKNIQNSQ